METLAIFVLRESGHIAENTFLPSCPLYPDKKWDKGSRGFSPQNPGNQAAMHVDIENKKRVYDFINVKQQITPPPLQKGGGPLSMTRVPDKNNW